MFRSVPNCDNTCWVHSVWAPEWLFVITTLIGGFCVKVLKGRDGDYSCIRIKYFES